MTDVSDKAYDVSLLEYNMIQLTNCQIEVLVENGLILLRHLYIGSIKHFTFYSERKGASTSITQGNVWYEEGQMITRFCMVAN